MGEPFDVYSDSFTVTITPWGVSLNLFASEAQPAALANSQASRLGTVRTSNEYLKAMTYLLYDRSRNTRLTIT